MALPDSPSPPSSPIMSRQPKRWARKCERACCSVLRYFPLAFVYSLTTWAVWAEVNIGYYEQRPKWTGRSTSILGVTFYILLNWSYTTAVFTDPGSPLDDKHSYSQLPTHDTSSFTVKSTGGTRFCKKCQARKPDRAHHCSSCQRCVLKMDHHCPWLASCLGLRNYKPFILFLTYTCIFCWICFAASSSWVWSEVLNDNYSDSLMPINFILLAVISGIIGLVLSGFTGWHMMLVCKGQTTIECLEKTRYLSPLRKTMHRQYQQRHSIDENPGVGQQLLDMHANALPGITRPEEGEERSSPTLEPSPAQRSLYRNYEDIEEAREREQYEDYMDEQDSEKLPHAFDLGWKRNLAHVLGPNKLLWLFPICNTTGNGWNWEPSPKWLEARETMRMEREARTREEHRQWPDQYATGETYNSYQPSSQSQGNVTLPKRPQSSMSMQTLQPSPDQGPSGDLLRGDESEEHHLGSQHVPSRGVWKDDRW